MNLYQRLLTETEQEKQYLFSAPIISQCFQGEITLDDYVAFLTQAYHHVKHTVPLLMSAGAKLPETKEWLREAVAEYIEEELGHQEWILNDIEQCGFNKESARHSTPAFATELMVAYAYDGVDRVNPLLLFGMVHVLEGTSIVIAENAADTIQKALSLPDEAFSYLRSHGALDQAHVKFFEDLMAKVTEQSEQEIIINSAKRFYKLYADIFRTLSRDHQIAKL